MNFLTGGTGEESNLPRTMLLKASKFAVDEGLFQRLNDLYTTIPEGKCQGCADCCMESVETHWIEFLQIYTFLQQKSDVLQKLLPGILKFYLLDGVLKLHCPFQIGNSKCAIYAVRPLPCRLFGQWGEEEYVANYAITLNHNQALADYYREKYKLILPQNVVNHKVAYCTQFQKAQNLSMEGFYDIMDEMMVIQSRLLVHGLIDESIVSPGLITWLMSTWFNLDELQDVKAGVMQGYLSGSLERLTVVSRHLEQMINRK